MRSLLAPDVQIFARIAELGTFAAVASENGLTPSGISRIVSRLESRIGTPLLHRTTRKLTLTPEGDIFLSYARRLMALAEVAEADLSHTLGKARGHLRVNCGTAFARRKLTPPYPEISIDVSVCDHRIDPVEKQIDVTIRVGFLEDSDLIAVRLGTVRRIIAASPRYLATRGTPQTIDDLLLHDCLLLTGFAGQAMWPMVSSGRVVDVAVKGKVTSDSADTLLHMAIEGVGIIRLGDFLGAEALASGQLIELFAGRHNDDPKPLTALILPKRQNIPRILAFVNFLKQEL